MSRTVHVIGNGDSSSLYLKEKRIGLKLTCNQIPFEIPDKWATVMVDFKMMDALTKYHSGDYSNGLAIPCLLYTSPSPRDGLLSRMPSSA